MAMINYDPHDSDYVEILAALPSNHLLALLQEVFRLRDYKLAHTEFEVRRWFVVEHSGILDPNTGYLKAECLLDSEYLALPLTVFTNETEFLQNGICIECGLDLTCSEKLALCPFCGTVTECT